MREWSSLSLHKIRFADILYPYVQVDATVLKFTPRVVPKIDVEYNILETVVKTVFQYRRSSFEGVQGQGNYCIQGDGSVVGHTGIDD